MTTLTLLAAVLVVRALAALLSCGAARLRRLGGPVLGWYRAQRDGEAHQLQRFGKLIKQTQTAS